MLKPFFQEKKVCLYFVSVLCIEKTRLFKSFLKEDKDVPILYFQSVSWLMTTWWCKESGFQQPWYWPCSGIIQWNCGNPVIGIVKRMTQCWRMWVYMQLYFHAVRLFWIWWANWPLGGRLHAFCCMISVWYLNSSLLSCCHMYNGHFDPLCSGMFWGNLNIYLHNM